MKADSKEVVQCWHCGAALPDLSLDTVRSPLPRAAVCVRCNADLHVCRMCEFYDTGVARSCRESVADEVSEKTRANFCGYFRLRPNAHAPADADAARRARAELAALFGEQTTPEGDAETDGLSAAEIARRQLDELFRC
ncbi:MAG: hypothetical protein KDK91_04245 [Gammaproteobacteria bacterium]|nr:hypothetical protein [Gammaproteobacteria bacterium]